MILEFIVWWFIGYSDYIMLIDYLIEIEWVKCEINLLYLLRIILKCWESMFVLNNRVIYSFVVG